MVDPLLIIDPGHGGKDPGGGTNKYWIEDELVLKISMYQYIRYKELGIPVAITRTDDTYIGPDERTRIVQESGATYCHSNHINAGGGDGAEVIHSIYSDGKMANIIAEAIKDAGQNVRRVFTRTYPGNDNLDYYYMIRETGSVITNIIEYGFADSPGDDVKQLRKHWKDYAEAVVKGFCEFIGHKYVAPGGGEYDPKYVQTGGLELSMIPEISAFLKEKSWWAEIRFDGSGTNPVAYTGGLSTTMLNEFENWLNDRGWWYKVI